MKFKSEAFRFQLKETPILAAVLLFGLFLGVALDQRDRIRLETQQREQANFVGVQVLQAMGDNLTRNALMLSRLTASAQILSELDTATFEQIASGIALDANRRNSIGQRTYPFVISISHAPNFIIDKVYPTVSNRELIGIDYNNEPNLFGSIEAALASFGPVLSQPFEAFNGQTAIAIREAVRDSRSEPRGIVSIAIDVESFLEFFNERALQSYGYRVSYALNGSTLRDDSLPTLQDPELVSFDTYGMTWTLSLAPEGGWSSLPLLTPTRMGIPIAFILLFLSAHLRFVREAQERRIVERLEKGIDALSAGFVIYDKNDRLLHWNQTYSELFGYRDLLKAGMSFESILRKGLEFGYFRVSKSEQEAWIKEQLERHRLSDHATEIELTNGRWIRAISRKTDDGDRVGIRFDVTDLKQAQLASERSSAAKSEFISMISHELRTPLTVILGFGRLLRLRQPTTSQTEYDVFARDALNRLILAGEGLLTLVNNMLDFTNLQAGALHQRRSRFELNHILSAAINQVTPLAKERSVFIKADEVNALANADPARVQQILEHILRNAVQFTFPKTTVSVECCVGAHDVKITVSDMGPGIPEDKLDLIFEEYSQLQPTSTRRQGGTGLGLALSKRLATLQGGDLFVESTLGQGSSFTLLLPSD
jgi:signal transduction histidine kinase